MMLKRAKQHKPEVDMTPMIDCVFLLLIFFLVATQIKESETRVKLRLPQSVEALLDLIEEKPRPITINIVAKGPNERGIGVKPFWMFGKAYNLEELKRVLQRQSKQQYDEHGKAATVRIRADRKSELLQLQTALKACQDYKILRVFIAAEKIRGR